MLNNRYVTFVLVGLTLLMLMLSIPGSLREAYERGGFYLFSQAFLEDIPKRLTGPGKFRFILQPMAAIILGIRSGMADAREGRPPCIEGVIFRKDLRGELIKSSLVSVFNVLLMGILLDSAFQWAIYGNSYPGAALVVGPVLILAPFLISRGLTNRAVRKPPTN